MSTTLIILCAALPLGDAEFIRGDANSDGVLSIADGHFIFSYLFRGFSEPECKDAADFDDAKGLNITDGVELIGHVLGSYPEPPPPFGAPGADPTPDDLDCGSYGSGSPLEDPGAALERLWMGSRTSWSASTCSSTSGVSGRTWGR